MWSGKQPLQRADPESQCCRDSGLEIRTALHLNLGKRPLTPSESHYASPFLKEGQEKDNDLRFYTDPESQCCRQVATSFKSWSDKQPFTPSESTNFAIFGSEKMDKKKTTTHAFTIVDHRAWKESACTSPFWSLNKDKKTITTHAFIFVDWVWEFGLPFI